MRQALMAEAVRAAAEGLARRDGGPFGAVIVRSGEVVCRAWNRVIREQDPTAHAEVNAIREACRLLGRFHLEDCELYTSCEPCPMCLGAIYWARLAGVCYAYSSMLFCLFFFWLLSVVCSCSLISPMTCCIFSAPK